MGAHTKMQIFKTLCDKPHRLTDEICNFAPRNDNAKHHLFSRYQRAEKDDQQFTKNNTPIYI